MLVYTRTSRAGRAPGGGGGLVMHLYIVYLHIRIYICIRKDVAAVKDLARSAERQATDVSEKVHANTDYFLGKRYRSFSAYFNISLYVLTERNKTSSPQ